MWLRALNHDTAFGLGDESVRLVVDPWLTPSQVDLAPWFSLQHHVRPWVQVADLATPDLVLVTFPFTDHCDRETLTRLPPAVPVAAPPRVATKIGR